MRVKGDSPLITNRFTEKQKMQLPAGKHALREQTGSAIPKKAEHAGPTESFINSLYWLSRKPVEYTQEAFDRAVAQGARWGIKAVAFKKAAIDAAYVLKWIPNKKCMAGAFRILADVVDEDGAQLVRIQGSVPEPREDVVILSGPGHKADLRWRGMFREWFCDLRIQYDENGRFSLEDICNMLNAGGCYMGVGDYRVERGGEFGIFSIAANDE